MERKTKINSYSEKKYSVPAIVNTFEILQVLSRKKYKESTLTEIANAVHLKPPTCYRLLQQLIELSLVRFDNNIKRYTLGPYLVVLGERAKESLEYIGICEPYLAKLTNDTELTSILVSRVDDHRLTQIAKNEGNHYGIKISIGRHFHIFDGDSYGNCFLAFMNEEERSELLKQDMKENNETLLKKLHHYQSLGFTWSYSKGDDSRFPGIFGISSPLFMEEGKLELCISVVGRTSQYTEEEVVNVIGPKVRRVAAQINEELRNEYRY